jgi:hypothetical protein
MNKRREVEQELRSKGEKESGRKEDKKSRREGLKD